MSSEAKPLISRSPQRGTYVPATKSDLRGPCPMINCLANHGYIPRDGRQIRVKDLTAALQEIGISSTLSTVFVNPIFLEYKNPASQKSQSIFWTIWYLICNPWAILFSSFGMRNPGQRDSAGEKCINLDQLDLHGVIEHDVSLSRRDYAEGDNHTPQPDLIEDILSSSSDGGKTLTLDDLWALKKRRIAKQKEVNPDLTYGAPQHNGACVEAALILDILGDGHVIRCDFARAFFREERLPVQEGWRQRRWWKLGFVEHFWRVSQVKRVMHIVF